MPEPLPRSLLDDFFNGKSTALQRQWLAEWLRHPENQAAFYLALDEWERRHPQYPADVDAALARFRAARQTPEPAAKPVETVPRRGFRAAWRWAAAVALLLAAGWLGRGVLFYETHRTAYGQTRAFRLPDGSTATLNANSALRVPRWGFGNRTREVRLDGEAEFRVRHLPDHRRFVVRTATDFSVEVLGTEFVLYARDVRRRVVLNQGRVKVTYQPGKQVLMRPGDWVALDAAGHLERHKTATPARFTAWKQHQFTFDQTRLADIAGAIHEHFGLRVHVADPTLAERRVSGVFQADKPDELLEALAELLQFRPEPTDDGVTLQPFSKN